MKENSKCISPSPYLRVFCRTRTSTLPAFVLFLASHRVLRERSRLATCSCVLSRPHAVQSPPPSCFSSRSVRLSRGLPDAARLSLSLSSYFFFLLRPRDHTGRGCPSVRTTDFLAGFYFRYDQGGDVDAYDIDAGGDDVP